MLALIFLTINTILPWIAMIILPITISMPGTEVVITISAIRLYIQDGFAYTAGGHVTCNYCLNAWNQVGVQS